MLYLKSNRLILNQRRKKLLLGQSNNFEEESQRLSSRINEEAGEIYQLTESEVATANEIRNKYLTEF